MANFLSPGINTNEYELKTATIAPTTISGAFAGVFKWGPCNRIINISSETDLLNTFGKPINDQILYSANVSVAESFFSAANFLAYSSNLNVIRSAVVTSSATANSDISYNATTSGIPIQITNGNFSSCWQVLNENRWIKDYDGLNIRTNTGRPYFIARYPGDLGNSLAVYVCSSQYGYSQAAYVRVPKTVGSKNLIGNNIVFTVDFLGSNSSVTASNTLFKGTATSPTKWNDFTVGDYIYLQDRTGGTVKSTRCVITGYSNTTITLDPDTNVNLNPAIVDSGSKNTSVYAILSWKHIKNFTKAPGTSAYCASANTKNDELHILVVDQLGKITGIPGTILEKYEGVSKCVDAKTDTGRSNFYVQRIFEDSKYIYVGRHLRDTDSSAGGTINYWGQTSAAGLSFALTDNYPAASSVYADNVTYGSENFKCGFDGNFSSDYNDITNSLTLFADKEKSNFDLIFSGPFGKNVKETICTIATTRKDCVAFISPERTSVLPSSGSANGIVVSTDVKDIIKEIQGSDDPSDTSIYSNINGGGGLQNLSSYCVMDSGWKYQYDKYNNNYKWLPLNPDIAGLCAQTDNNNGSWWSPAGYTRGIIRNCIRLSWNPNQSERDTLYPVGINPVVTFPEGTILYGDKTLSPYPSAFDRINVRRLFLTLEKTISRAAKASLFEFNDQFTRAQFIALVDPFLRSIKANRGIYDYRVICDDTNNTPTVIDANQFIGDIYIKPAKSISFIQLNFTAVGTGIDFSTIIL